MTERRLETQPTTVPNEARRAGEIWGIAGLEKLDNDISGKAALN